MEDASCLSFSSPNRDCGRGFWEFDCLVAVYNFVVLFLVFVLGFKVLQLSSHCKEVDRFFSEFRKKSVELGNGFCSSDDGGGYFDKAFMVFRDKCFTSRPNLREILEEDEERKEEKGEDWEEEDLMGLKRAIRIERERRKAVCLELEKERKAAAIAAEEAMTVIQHIQNEKGLVEMEARQYRRVAEEKQVYDREVIQSLRWIISKHELERRSLETQLMLCRQRLLKKGLCEVGMEKDEERLCDETDNEGLNCSVGVEEGLVDGLISSLDLDSSIN